MKLETFTNRFFLLPAIKQARDDQFTNIFHIMPRNKDAVLDNALAEIEIKFRDRRWIGTVVSQKLNSRVTTDHINVSMGTLDDAKLEMMTQLAAIA